MKKQFQAYLLIIALVCALVAPDTIQAKEIDMATTMQTEVPQEDAVQKTTFPVHVIHKTGDDKENFVIVLMGDGYTAEEQDKFLQEATAKARGMLTWSPYKEYSDRINIYAVQTVSNESGISEYGGNTVDTYFHVCVFGKAAGFTGGGDEKAKALRQELEEKYLDDGANVGTIHVLCNSDGSYGASVNSLFSFSSNSGDNQNGTVMAHEIAHSIGGLGDEYERYTNKPNTSDTSNPETIKWAKMLGFRGVGITMAGTETSFAPSRECMMRWLGQPFCEVCKMELARKLNNPEYVSRPAAMYVSDPEISIAHNRTGTLDRDSEKYRITEKNITKANDDDLEFRTIVQNLENRERHLKMTFRITGADGATVKYAQEKTFTIPALSNWYDPDASRESISVVIPFVYDLVSGDKLEGKIIDEETGEVLATDKTADQAWSTVNLHYQLKKEDGTTTDISNTEETVVHVPKDSTYTLRKPNLSGYSYVGNDQEAEAITVSQASIDVTYYYEVDKKSEEIPEPAPEQTPSATPSASPSPSATPSATPALEPVHPVATPTTTPSVAPSALPSTTPSAKPTLKPEIPTITPTETPTPTTTPSTSPNVTSTQMPSVQVPEVPEQNSSIISYKKQNKKKKRKTITIVLKVKKKRKIYAALKKAVKRVEKRAKKQKKNIVVKIVYKARKTKKWKLDRTTKKFLARKKIKKVQWVKKSK